MTSLFTVSNIYFSIYYIPTSQLLITILLVWEEGELVGGGTQQYDGVLERVYNPAPNAATSSPFSLIHLGKHDEVSGDTPIIGLALITTSSSTLASTMHRPSYWTRSSGTATPSWFCFRNFTLTNTVKCVGEQMNRNLTFLH